LLLLLLLERRSATLISCYWIQNGKHDHIEETEQDDTITVAFL